MAFERLEGRQRWSEDGAEAFGSDGARQAQEKVLCQNCWQEACCRCFLLPGLKVVFLKSGSERKLQIHERASVSIYRFVHKPSINTYVKKSYAWSLGHLQASAGQASGRLGFSGFFLYLVPTSELPGDSSDTRRSF